MKQRVNILKGSEYFLYPRKKFILFLINHSAPHTDRNKTEM